MEHILFYRNGVCMGVAAILVKWPKQSNENQSNSPVISEKKMLR